MHKKVVLYLIFILITSCSVFKIQSKTSPDNKSTGNEGTLQKFNLTNNSFFVQKAEVDLVSENKKESFLISVKFSKPDTFLISIKSKAGIEAARVFLTRDTLLINDRINRILYYGSADGMKRKFGYSSKLLPALFGDFVLTNISSEIDKDCTDGVYNIISNFQGFRLEYMIDCNTERTKMLELSDETNINRIILHFSESRKIGQFYYYSKIFIPEFRDYKLLNVNIKNIEIPYNDHIEFVPGKNYERIGIR